MNKFCKKCGEQINEGTDFCLKCGNQITKNNQNNKKKVPVWAIVILSIIGIIIIIGVIAGLATNSVNKSLDDATKKAECSNDGGIWENNKCNLNDTNTDNNNSNYSINKPFEFDGLEITISNKINFMTLDDHYGKDSGKEIMVIPVTIKNLSDKQHTPINQFFYRFYNPKWTHINNVSSYFIDDSIDFAGYLQPGVIYNKNFYIVYDGDGDYYVILTDIFKDEIKVEFSIKKGLS